MHYKLNPPFPSCITNLTPPSHHALQTYPPSHHALQTYPPFPSCITNLTTFPITNLTILIMPHTTVKQGIATTYVDLVWCSCRWESNSHQLTIFICYPKLHIKHGVIASVVWNGHSNLSSNTGQGCLHFT